MTSEGGECHGVRGGDVGRSSLAGLRAKLGLTQEQVAARMGVEPEQVAAIEHGDPATVPARTLAGYCEALGGRLDLTAEIGDARIPLR